MGARPRPPRAAQVRLDNLAKRFQKDTDALASYVSEKSGYAGRAEAVDSVEGAKYFIEEHSLQTKEIEVGCAAGPARDGSPPRRQMSKNLRLEYLSGVLAELGKEKYEFYGQLSSACPNTDPRRTQNGKGDSPRPRDGRRVLRRQ